MKQNESSKHIKDQQQQIQQQQQQQQLSLKQQIEQKFWPVFGKNPLDDPNSTKFWNKDKTRVNKELIIKIQGRLQRVGQKKQEIKQYFYYLQGTYLCYKEKPTDKLIKGYLKLGPHIQVEKGSYKGKKEEVHFLEFIKNQTIKRKLYSKDEVVINDWFMYVRNYCILSNFDQQYEWQDRLGSGSFSTVFKVKRKIDGQIYAAKVYYKTKLHESKHVDRFVQMMKNEYAVLKKMDHPNIVKIYELFQESEMIMYLMDYVPGGEIYSTLKKLKTFEEKDAAYVIKQLADALQTLHIENIVHRDLKLENIMMVSTESYDIKIIDFGFAEKVNRHKLVSRAGTPGFLPPELFKLSPYTEKGDIFSLGIILYSLLVGTTPFKGDTYRNVLELNKQNKINYNQESLKKYSPNCIECLQNMLKSTPEARYSAQDILDSQWVQFYYPDNQVLDSELSLSNQSEGSVVKNYATGKSSIFLKSNYDNDTNIDDRGTFVGSSFNHINSEGVKTLYRRSQKSCASQSKMSKNTQGMSYKYFTDFSDTNQSVNDDDELGINIDLNQSLVKTKTKFIKNLTTMSTVKKDKEQNNISSLTQTNINSLKQIDIQQHTLQQIQKNKTQSSINNIELDDDQKHKVHIHMDNLDNLKPKFLQYITKTTLYAHQIQQTTSNSNNNT